MIHIYRARGSFFQSKAKLPLEKLVLLQRFEKLGHQNPASFVLRGRRRMKDESALRFFFLKSRQCESAHDIKMAAQLDGESEARRDERVGENLAPFNPSSQPVVEIAMRLLFLKSTDILYELGCGIRFQIHAATFTNILNKSA